MFVYEKKLQYPVKIHTPNPRLAAIIITPYGGRYSNRLQYQTFQTPSPEPGEGVLRYLSRYIFCKSCTFVAFSIC